MNLYIITRFLFRIVLKVFYGSIVVENAHFVPETGIPWKALQLSHLLPFLTIYTALSVLITVTPLQMPCLSSLFLIASGPR